MKKSIRGRFFESISGVKEPDPSFWPFIRELSDSGTLSRIGEGSEGELEIKWLTFELNLGELSLFLETAAKQNHRLLASYYKDSSILRSVDDLERMLHILFKLEAVRFDLPLESEIAIKVTDVDAIKEAAEEDLFSTNDPESCDVVSARLPINALPREPMEAEIDDMIAGAKEQIDVATEEAEELMDAATDDAEPPIEEELPVTIEEEEHHIFAIDDIKNEEESLNGSQEAISNTMERKSKSPRESPLAEQQELILEEEAEQDAAEAAAAENAKISEAGLEDETKVNEEAETSAKDEMEEILETKAEELQDGFLEEEPADTIESGDNAEELVATEELQSITEQGSSHRAPVVTLIASPLLDAAEGEEMVYADAQEESASPFSLMPTRHASIETPSSSLWAIPQSITSHLPSIFGRIGAAAMDTLGRVAGQAAAGIEAMGGNGMSAMGPCPFKLSICPSKGLYRQGFRCRDCGQSIAFGSSPTARLCEHTGAYFCGDCFGGEQPMPVPGRILCDWDFQPFWVSKGAASDIQKYIKQPFDLQHANPRLYLEMVPLQELDKARRSLKLAVDLIDGCSASGHTDIRQSFAAHWIPAANAYSVQDLIDLEAASQDRTMLHKTQEAIERIKLHVDSCEHCTSKGQVCNSCEDVDPIYRYEIDRVVSCSRCQNLRHESCSRQQPDCPTCQVTP